LAITDAQTGKLAKTGPHGVESAASKISHLGLPSKCVFVYLHKTTALAQERDSMSLERLRDHLSKKALAREIASGFQNGWRPSRQITVRDGKGMKDRVTVVPDSAVEQIKAQIAYVRSLHERDLDDGFGEVFLPFALEAKYPNASKELGWQYLFPAHRISQDKRSRRFRRHHIHEDTVRAG
jgi:hypothetical protein